ncbi:MAG: HK97 family phage prohead protease, partial [Clostridium celatum]|nr:HK97 family phage prohead protease [Clostridium celatum]
MREIGEDKEVHMQGYALTFDTVSEDLGFRETIRKGALDGTDISNV